MRVEIKTTELKQVSGRSGKTGKDYSFFTQQAYAHLAGKPYPVEMRINVDAGQSAYALGFYALSPASYYVDKYGNLGLSPKLISESK